MPSVVDFGRVRPEDDASQVILVSNVGQTRLDIESIEMNGSQDFSFEVRESIREKTQPSCLTPMEMANRVWLPTVGSRSRSVCHGISWAG